MAKKFVFRLEAVLSIRTKAVEDAKIALGKTLSERTAKEQEIRQQEEYISTLMSNTDVRGRSSALMIEAQWHHLRVAKKDLQQLEEQKAQLLRLEADKRRKLALALQQEKALLQLKEKQLQEYVRAEDHAEQAFLDDIAQRTHNNLLS
jgi:flagellar export protein FliJ